MCCPCFNEGEDLTVNESEDQVYVLENLVIKCIPASLLNKEACMTKQPTKNTTTDGLCNVECTCKIANSTPCKANCGSTYQTICFNAYTPTRKHSFRPSNYNDVEKNSNPLVENKMVPHLNPTKSDTNYLKHVENTMVHRLNPPKSDSNNLKHQDMFLNVSKTPNGLPGPSDSLSSFMNTLQLNEKDIYFNDNFSERSDSLKFGSNASFLKESIVQPPKFAQDKQGVLKNDKAVQKEVEKNMFKNEKNHFKNEKIDDNYPPEVKKAIEILNRRPQNRIPGVSSKNHRTLKYPIRDHLSRVTENTEKDYSLSLNYEESSQVSNDDNNTYFEFSNCNKSDSYKKQESVVDTGSDMDVNDGKWKIIISQHKQDRKNCPEYENNEWDTYK